MRLTRGETVALICLVLVVAGFLPPVTTWAAKVEARVLGLPFLLFWNSLMILTTAALMSLALVIKDRLDRR
jgi:hypothetical protein